MVRVVCLLFTIFCLTACGARYGELKRLDLTVPTPTGEKLDAVAAFTAGANRLNTYERWVNGARTGETSRTLTMVRPDRTAWRAYDSMGNWIDFALQPDSGLSLERAHNGTYKRYIDFDPALGFCPPLLAQGESFTSTAKFSAWADDWTTKTGTLKLTTRFVGREPAETGLGALADCVRLESDFDVTFILGIRVWFTQRQWIHPEYGEVLRDINGKFGLLGMGLQSFTSRQIIMASRPVTNAEVAYLFSQEEMEKMKKKRKPQRER